MEEEILKILEDGRDLESLSDKVDWLYRATRTLALAVHDLHISSRWTLRLLSAIISLLGALIGLKFFL